MHNERITFLFVIVFLFAIGVVLPKAVHGVVDKNSFVLFEQNKIHLKNFPDHKVSSEKIALLNERAKMNFAPQLFLVGNTPKKKPKRYKIFTTPKSTKNKTHYKKPRIKKPYHPQKKGPWSEA